MTASRHIVWPFWAALGLLVSLSGCVDDSLEPETQADTSADVVDDLTRGVGPLIPTLGDVFQLIPADNLPSEAVTQDANNNLDVIMHDERLFLVWRTAPTHFASDLVQMHMVSSSDGGQTWAYEATFSMQTDLRECRFLSVNGALLLYFASLGDNSLDFEPGRTFVTRYQGPGDWTEPTEIFEPGFIPWRLRDIGGVSYMIGYVGGEDIYEFAEEIDPIEVFFMTTADGETFDPVTPDQPVVLEGGVSETDFAILDDGTLIAVGRNEAGDEDGFGSKICRAEAGDFGNWRCETDLKKYDSPLVFTHRNQVYLIARRNVTDTGDYDLQREGWTLQQERAQYQYDYWNMPKRCSLWWVDPVELRVEFLLDLPSRGDTCFPSILQVSENEYDVYNYTSPLDGADVSWIRGQTGTTSIHRLRLTFPEP